MLSKVARLPGPPSGPRSRAGEGQGGVGHLVVRHRSRSGHHILRRILRNDATPRTSRLSQVSPECTEHGLIRAAHPAGEHCFTLTVTDIATGWTENRTVRNKAQKWVFAALQDITNSFPFPIIGIDSDNGSEFINWHLLRWCETNKITFTRSRSGNSNDGAHVEQKNWAVVRTVAGYHRYDTAAELLLLNKIWALQTSITNFFNPQQKLIPKVRNGAKVTKKYDIAMTPNQRAQRHAKVTETAKTALTKTYKDLNPAAIQRQIQALTRAADPHHIQVRSSQKAHSRQHTKAGTFR